MTLRILHYRLIFHPEEVGEEKVEKRGKKQYSSNFFSKLGVKKTSFSFSYGTLYESTSELAGTHYTQVDRNFVST